MMANVMAPFEPESVVMAADFIRAVKPGLVFSRLKAMASEASDQINRIACMSNVMTST